MVEKVAVFRAALLGGSETFIRNQTDALTRWSPSLVGLELQPSPLVREHDTILYRGRSARLRVRAAKLRGHSPKLTAFLRAEKPRLLHAHFGFDGVTALRSARKTATPLIVTFHGVDATAEAHAPGLRGALYRSRLRRLLHSADRIVAVSQPIAAALIALGAPPDRVTVHHIGIPIPATASVGAHERRGVLFVGRLTDKKGVDDLLRAYAKLDSVTRDAHPLTIVGEGPLRDRLEALAVSLGTKASFRGAQPPPAVTALMGSTALLAVPSKTAPNGDTEGLPMVVLEAGALSTPVVAYAHSGIPEAVIDGVTGKLAPEGDVAALAGHMDSLLSDIPARDALGSAARTHIAANFDIARQTELLETIYDAVARGATRAR